MDHRSLLRPLSWLPLLICLVWPAFAAAAIEEPFVIEDIEVIGLQRITDGTLFNYLPVSIGDELTAQRAAQSLRALYGTQFFRDVQFRRDGDRLVIVVIERPTIASFSVTGNNDIPDEDLHSVLRGIGLAEGRIFNRGVLEDVQVELRRQYFNRGKYAVRVDTEVDDIPGNMVEVSITIEEGRVARIREVNFVGNEAFPNSELARQLELRRTNWLSFYRKDDQYSREKLQGDLETLRSYYMNQGYAAFDVTSVQVAISPDKRDIYITIGVEEGDRYRIGEVQLAGNLIVDEDELQPLVLFRVGDSFNRSVITTSEEFLARRLGEEGYANAEVLALPNVDEEALTVDITLHFDPGRRMYVRRINFSGGERTNDETFRREMRQLEGTWLQTSAMERSRIRLQRLPFLENVEVETTPVPGSDELVDIDVELSERAPGHFNVGMGWSAGYGLMLSTGITHSNMFGEGKRLQLDLERSRFSERYNVNYTDPYWTVDGVSRTWGVFYQDADQMFARGSQMFINTYGVSNSYGIPLTEYTRFDIGASLAQTELMGSLRSSDHLLQWVTNPNHGTNFTRGDPAFPFAQVWGTRFTMVEVSGGYTFDSRNRAIFASRGSQRGVNFEVGVPPGEVTFVKGTLFNHTYIPAGRSAVFIARAEATAGKGYGDTQQLPPFKHVFGGGPDSVRGYREHWLGPLDAAGFPLGGNIRIFGQLELMIPPPFEAMRQNTRFGVFYDVGNVFLGRDDVSFDDLRMSVGLAATWLAPIGAMRLSLAYPLNRQEGDRLERLQFSMGSSF